MLNATTPPAIPSAIVPAVAKLESADEKDPHTMSRTVRYKYPPGTIGTMPGINIISVGVLLILALVSEKSAATALDINAAQKSETVSLSIPK